MIDGFKERSLDFGGRSEYNELDATDKDGPATVVAEMIEDLLYEDSESTRVTCDEYRAEANEHERSVTKAFSYFRGDRDQPEAPLTEVKVVLRHTRDNHLRADTYQVALNWSVEGTRIIGDIALTSYAIDIGADGAVQAFIDEPNVFDNGRTTRRMVSYDHATLFDELGILADLHAAERLDNARSV